MQLEASVSSVVTIGDEGEAGALKRRVVVSSALVTAKTAPDGRSLKSFGVAIWRIKDNHIVVVPIAFGISLSSEEANVEGDVLDLLVGDRDMPSTLTASTVEARIRLGHNFRALAVYL